MVITIEGSCGSLCYGGPVADTVYKGSSCIYSICAPWCKSMQNVVLQAILVPWYSREHPRKMYVSERQKCFPLLVYSPSMIWHHMLILLNSSGNEFCSMDELYLCTNLGNNVIPDTTIEKCIINYKIRNCGAVEARFPLWSAWTVLTVYENSWLISNL